MTGIGGGKRGGGRKPKEYIISGERKTKKSEIAKEERSVSEVRCCTTVHKEYEDYTKPVEMIEERRRRKKKARMPKCLSSVPSKKEEDHLRFKVV